MANILIIDDSKDVRDIMSLLLGHAGHNVVVTAEANQALQLCKDVSFDLVICDMIMPPSKEITRESLSVGVHVIKKLTECYPNLPVIAMSGAVDNAVLDRMSNFGAKGIISKPFNFDDLVKTISAFIPPAA